MDRNLFVRLVIITSYIPLIFCMRIKEGDKCNPGIENIEKCLKDGSVIDWKCVDDKSSENYGTFVKSFEEGCDKGSKCRCETAWDRTYCDCEDQKRYPYFPYTGVIRWNRTKSLEYVSTAKSTKKRIFNTPGEIKKDNSGRFLHKWSVSGNDWIQTSRKPGNTTMKFIIVMPFGNGTSLKYMGDDQSKTCKASFINYEPYLHSFYNEKSVKDGLGRNDRVKFRDSVEINDTLRRETWEQTRTWRQTRTDSEAWTWTIDYDKKAKLSLPVRYVHRFTTSYVRWFNTLDYTYEPIEDEEDITINLDDYCDENLIQYI